jgi:hypothetical protein
MQAQMLSMLVIDALYMHPICFLTICLGRSTFILLTILARARCEYPSPRM